MRDDYTGHGYGPTLPCRLCDDRHEQGEPCYLGLVKGLLIAVPAGALFWTLILWALSRWGLL